MINAGDIITTTCHINLIGCFHIGVAVMENDGLKIYHHTPTIKNEFGGNIVKQPVDQFLEHRKIKKIIPANVPAQEVIRVANANKTRKWTPFYNCEDFINQITNQYGSINRLRLFAGIGAGVWILRKLII